MEQMQGSPGTRAISLNPAERRMFRYPLEPCPRVAVLCDTLQVPPDCFQMPERTSLGPFSIEAETIAAPASSLLYISADWKPSFPLVVFTGTRYGFLDDGDRHEIWRRFAVPVFEQLLDDEGRVLAFECEAHIGLHVDPAVRHTLSGGELLVNGRPSGITVREAHGICGCGKPGPRLLEPAPAFAAAAAYSSI
jgi:hypothetical protein